MNRGTWQATVHGVARVRQDLVIQPPPPNQLKDHWLSLPQGKDQKGHTMRSITHSGLLNSCLENSKDRGAWQAIVHGVTKSQTWLVTEHTHYSFSHQASFHSVLPLVWSTLQEILEIIPIFFLCHRDQKHIITNHNLSIFLGSWNDRWTCPITGRYWQFSVMERKLNFDSGYFDYFLRLGPNYL